MVKFACEFALQRRGTQDVAEALSRRGQREVGTRDIKGERSSAGCPGWPRKATAAIDANLIADENDVAKHDIRRIAVDGCLSSDWLPHELCVDDLGVLEVACFQRFQGDRAQDEA